MLVLLKETEICSEGKASLSNFLMLKGNTVMSPASLLGSFKIFCHMLIKYANA